MCVVLLLFWLILRESKRKNLTLFPFLLHILTNGTERIPFSVCQSGIYREVGGPFNKKYKKKN